MTKKTRQITITTTRTLDVPEYGTHLDAVTLKKLVSDSGSHYFDADTMRGFKSRLHDIIAGPDGWYFITSEKHEAYTSYRVINEPRKYSVRRLRINTKGDDLSIDTLGEFQQYPSLGTARTAARKFAKTGALICEHCTGTPEHESWCRTQQQVKGA